MLPEFQLVRHVSQLNNIQYTLPINTCYYNIYPFIALSQSAQRCFRVNVVTQFHHDTERHAKENPSDKNTTIEIRTQAAARSDIRYYCLLSEFIERQASTGQLN